MFYAIANIVESGIKHNNPKPLSIFQYFCWIFEPNVISYFLFIIEPFYYSLINSDVYYQFGCYIVTLYKDK
jgi:hypothetical protein